MRLPPKMTVNAPKPDLVQLVSQLPAGAVAGCKWCKKTIFWNGSFWNHVDGDQHKCAVVYGRRQSDHDLEVIGHEEREIGRTFWLSRPITGKAPVHRCTLCGKQAVARPDYTFSGVFEGDWVYGLENKCPAKVATPHKPGGSA